MKPTFSDEKKLWQKGYKYVIGIDEVGRGAFAGPVVVSAVAFDKNVALNKDQLLWLSEIDDSKRIKPRKREQLSKEIKNQTFFSIIAVPVRTINKCGIGKATQIGFRSAVAELRNKISQNIKYFVLVDGFHVRYLRGIGLANQKAIIKGDQKSISIAAASIIAKVYRDKLMKRLSRKYPQYGLSKNKGYGTKEHRIAIKKFRLCKLHRKSFIKG